MSSSPLHRDAAPRAEDDESGYTFTLPTGATVAAIEAMQRTDAEALHSVAIVGVRIAQTMHAVNGVYTRSALRTPSGVPVFTSGAQGDDALHLFCSTEGVWYVGTAEEAATGTTEREKRGVVVEEVPLEKAAAAEEAASVDGEVVSRKRRMAPRAQKRAARARVTAPPRLTRSAKRAELFTELRQKVLVVPQSMRAGITLCSTDAMKSAGVGSARDTTCFHSFDFSPSVGGAGRAPPRGGRVEGKRGGGEATDAADEGSSLAARECPSLRRFDILTSVNGVDARTVASFQEVVAMVLQASRPMTLIFETARALDEREARVVAPLCTGSADSANGARRALGLMRSTTHSSSPLGLRWETRVVRAAAAGGVPGATDPGAWRADATVSVGSPVQCRGWRFRPFERRRWDV
jgi:hypothetical protein